MRHLSSRHLLTLSIELHPIYDLGQTPVGQRRIVPVSGGAFKNLALLRDRRTKI